MIEAKELRVGNKILSIFDKVETVRMILGHEGSEEYPKQYKHLIGVEENGNQYNLAEIKPIPLTEEWLLKFGFVQGEYKLWLSIPQIKSEIHFDKFRGSLVCQIYSSTGSLIPKDIKYIHQLQNLYFALTGEELEIND